MMNAWPLVSLGNILIKSNAWIDLKPDETYKEVTVRLWGKGVTLRREVNGTGIAAERRIAVKKNQFILSRIDARNGAFGLIPDSLDGGVVSTDFPVFTVNDSLILPAYLDWMSKTADFVDLCKSASEGTTNRVRLKEDRFLVMQVALPSLDEQRRLVARIEALAAKIEEARGLRRLAVEEAEALLYSALRQIFTLDSHFKEIKLENVCESIIDNLHSNPVYSENGTV
jgi:type I restriction enzyme S subunit